MKGLVYAYIYYDPRDGTPFYVGKGKEWRARKHLNANHRRNLILANKIIQIRRECSQEPIIQYWFCACDTEAKVLEIQLIAAFGRRDLGKGPLLNYTDGGEGSLGRKGFVHTEETKRRVSEKLKGRIVTGEHRARIGAANKGRPGPSPEHLAKMIAGSRTPEARRRMSEAQKKVCNLEHLKRISELGAQKKRGSKDSEETRAKKSKAMQGRKFSEETLRKMSAAQTKRYAKCTN